ncbi:MAG: hypothetical protein KAT04_04370 [Methylococcales bacterium]|nr:hypothetical protein [Methylococcales bacterium]
MKKSNLLLGCIVLSTLSFSIHAETDSSAPEQVIVKKYFVGKPGYNRHAVIVHQKDIVDKINDQLVSDTLAAGLLSVHKSKKAISARQRKLKFRRHP